MILEVLVAGGGTFSAIALTAWATRPARRKRTECERLHRVAAMERDIYGQVMSSDAAEHVKKCGITTVGFNAYVQAASRSALTVSGEDVKHLRELVAECEQIKRMIQDVEDLRIEKPSPLIVTGIDPRAIREKERLAELRAMLQVKREAMAALTRAWESDPQNGPGATRIC